MSVPSRLNILGIVESVACVLAQRMGASSIESDRFGLAVIEAASNAVKHGHKKDPSKLVDLEFRAWPDRVEVTVHDSGAGFDPTDMDLSITRDEAAFLAGQGRGIYIMRQCVDAIEFTFGSDGTHCHLVKYLEASAEAPNAPAGASENPPVST